MSKKLKEVDRLEIAFYKGTGLVSKMVENATQSKYSHCAFIVTYMEGSKVRRVVYDINWNRTFGAHKLKWKQREYDSILVNFEPDDEVVILDYLNNHRNKVKYDFMVNILFLLKKFNIHIPLVYLHEDKQRWNRVESVYELIHKLNPNIQLDINDMTPESLYEEMLSRSVDVTTNEIIYETSNLINAYKGEISNI